MKRTTLQDTGEFRLHCLKVDNHWAAFRSLRSWLNIKIIYINRNKPTTRKRGRPRKNPQPK